ncbi:uncharacterized protein TM35_001401000 [Trypanosoma theileri]|uniref:Uncharacterized protein n=1 Tax=Trypanosoma theileri TaxID=67003 RepID=A0A1X0NE46_9TRYP|nr:uncharacterized protein TM35_001401000 [Trypanosoma theileri]ORC80837.1 hypothetical protein TM35_001401000 [Trypanosoma theileri]
MHLIQNLRILRTSTTVQRKNLNRLTTTKLLKDKQLSLRMLMLLRTVQRLNQQRTLPIFPIMRNRPLLPPPQQQHFLLNSQTTRRVMQTAAAAVSSVLCGCVYHY